VNTDVEREHRKRDVALRQQSLPPPLHVAMTLQRVLQRVRHGKSPVWRWQNTFTATEPGVGIASESKTRWGWGAGAGVEAARITTSY
jgi:opacity protein-like surface antigen